jgi:chromosome segregation ATPase
LVRELESAAAAARAEHASQLQETQDQLQAALDHLQRAEDGHEALQNELDELRTAHETGRREMERALAVSTERTAALEHCTTSLEEQLTQTQQALEAQRMNFARTENKAEVAEATAKRLQVANDALVQDHEAMREKWSAASQEAAVAQARLAERLETGKRLETELQACRVELAQERHEAREWRKRADVSEAKTVAAEKRAEALQVQANESAAAMGRLEREVHALRGEMARSAGAP